jgi:hypothetical protein
MVCVVYYAYNITLDYACCGCIMMMEDERAVMRALVALPTLACPSVSFRCNHNLLCTHLAATAALLKKQNPMARPPSAWCPGGRMMAAPPGA